MIPVGSRQFWETRRSLSIAFTMDTDVISVSSDEPDDVVECVHSGEEESFRKRLRHTIEDIEGSGDSDLPHASIPASRSPKRPVSPLVWKRISRWFPRGAAPICLQLLCVFLSTLELAFADLDFLEYFAGCQSMTKSLALSNCRAYGYEILQDRVPFFVTHGEHRHKSRFVKLPAGARRHFGKAWLHICSNVALPNLWRWVRLVCSGMFIVGLPEQKQDRQKCCLSSRVARL